MAHWPSVNQLEHSLVWFPPKEGPATLLQPPLTFHTALGQFISVRPSPILAFPLSGPTT